MKDAAEQLEAKLRAIRNEYWYRGNLRYLTRPGPQRELYDWMKFIRSQGVDFAPFVLNCRRRMGKTFLSTLLCWEECLSRPGVYAKLAAPSASQAADILDEHWGVMLNECPYDLEPAPFRNEKFTFRNPRWGTSQRYAKSILRLYGVLNDRGNKMRGGSTDICVLDECREMKELEYIWGSVLLPTFKGRQSPFALMISTPPESMDHPWVAKYIREAIEKSRYRMVPGSKDPTWSEEEDELFAREMGGRDSMDYRREIECELISDTTNLIIPEFAEHDHYTETGIENELVIPPEGIKRPDYYDAYSVCDMGGAGRTTDRCGILHSHYDFLNKRIVFEHEEFLRDLDSKKIVDRWRESLGETFSADREKAQGRTIQQLNVRAETNPQQITDFRAIWGFDVQPCPPMEREAARRFLRSAMRMGQIKISAACKDLIYQLRNGTRLDNGRFASSERLGHCDLIAAAINTLKVVDWERNPFPPRAVSRDEVFVVPEETSTGAWNQLFRKKRGN